jgi:outer membrane lipoprotein
MRHATIAIVLILTAAPAALLSGCASIPPPLAGNDFVDQTPTQVAAANGSGELVRWGGEILVVEPHADSTCLAIQSHRLHADARPDPFRESNGIFIACQSDFIDPAMYTVGREITVVGKVEGSEQYQIDLHNYRFATVNASGIYLWPERWYDERGVFANASWNNCLDVFVDFNCYGWNWGTSYGYSGNYYHHHHHPHWLASTASYKPAYHMSTMRFAHQGYNFGRGSGYGGRSGPSGGTSGSGHASSSSSGSVASSGVSSGGSGGGGAGHSH